MVHIVFVEYEDSIANGQCSKNELQKRFQLFKMESFQNIQEDFILFPIRLIPFPNSKI